MTLKQPDPAKANPKYATTYQASRGCHYPPTPKPVPGTPKTDGKR